VCTRSFQVRPSGSWPWTSTRLPGRRTWLPFSALPTRCRCLSPWDGPGWATVLTCGSSSGSPCPRAWRGTWGATHLTCIMERWHQVGLDLIRPPFSRPGHHAQRRFRQPDCSAPAGRIGARWEQLVSAVPLTTACRCERLSGKRHAPGSVKRRNGGVLADAPVKWGPRWNVVPAAALHGCGSGRRLELFTLSHGQSTGLFFCLKHCRFATSHLRQAMVGFFGDGMVTTRAVTYRSRLDCRDRVRRGAV